MKNILFLITVFALAAVLLASCGVPDAGENGSGLPESSTAQDEVKVLDHDGFSAADLSSDVTVETYVQAKQSWWENKATVYAQSEDGGYFIYEMSCSKEDYGKLVPGTKIRVTGKKAEWNGQIEITEAKFEILEGSYIAQPTDVTSLVGNGQLTEHRNEYVSFKGMTVEPSKAQNGKETAFLYGWEGGGEQGDDLYFTASKDGVSVTFTVESYLCDKDTEVYKAVELLTVGSVIDIEGFLYWYNGANPHVTSVMKAD